MSKEKVVFSIVVALLIGCGTIVAQAPVISIPIVDADFEQQTSTGYVQTINDPPGCGIAEQGLAAGWTFTSLIDGAGRGVAAWKCDDGMPPSNVAFLLGSSMDQVLTEKPRFGTYVLQFDVANWFYSYDGDWKAELYQGNSPAPFCSESGWVRGEMRRMTVTCNFPQGFADNSKDSLTAYGQTTGNVRIHFQNGVANPALGGHSAWPILLDNVSVSFSPQL